MFLQISLLTGLIELKLILTSASLCNLLQYVVLVKIYEQDRSLEKRGNILIAFPDICGYSLILHQNSTVVF